jgi:predicted ester cyclase
MERQEVKKWSDELHAYYNAHDAAGIASMLAPSFIVHMTSAPGGVMDREAYLGMWHATWNAFPDLRYDTQDELIDGDKVVLRVSLIGTHLGEYIGIPATGRPTRTEVIDIIRYANGQAVEEWAEYNQLAMMQQLGLAQVPAAA